MAKRVIRYRRKLKECVKCGMPKKILFKADSYVISPAGEKQKVFNIDEQVWDVCSNCGHVNLYLP